MYSLSILIIFISEELGRFTTKNRLRRQVANLAKPYQSTETDKKYNYFTHGKM